MKNMARLGLAMSKREDSHGIQLRSYNLPNPAIPLFFAKVDRALTLIEEAEPRRFRRIRRDVRIIAGEPAGGSYWYEPLRMIALSWRMVLPRPVAEVAMTIVHEATHARIGDRGITYDEPHRARIEAACVRQEAAFARRLPEGEALAASHLAGLERPWWSDESIQRSKIEQLRESDVPRWLVELVDRKYRKRVAAAQRQEGKTDRPPRSS